MTDINDYMEGSVSNNESKQLSTSAKIPLHQHRFVHYGKRLRSNSVHNGLKTILYGNSHDIVKLSRRLGRKR